MAHVYKAASAVIGTSGSNTKPYRISFSGSHATNIGSVELLTGGAGGTSVWKMFVSPGHADQMELPAALTFDYLTIADATVFLEYYKVHGVA